MSANSVGTTEQSLSHLIIVITLIIFVVHRYLVRVVFEDGLGSTTGESVAKIT